MSATPKEKNDATGPVFNQLSVDNPVSPRFKFAILILLCCQNAGHALLARYSQGILKEQYSSTEVVLVGEVMKLVISGYLTLTDRAETDAVGTGTGKLFWLVLNAKKIVVLVILYSIANITSYYALARVDASVYTVLLQLKIFTTAAFGVILLGRRYSSTKWRALVLLVLGCVLVASPTYNRPVDCDAVNDKKAGGGGSDDEKVGYIGQLLGVCSVLAMVAISGYSAIYFEAMLKKSGEKITIWERNFQLAFYSIVLLIGLVIAESTQLSGTSKYAILNGWTFNTWLIAIIQAAGGLLVAATLKYADAVLKTLATSGAIVLSAVLGWFLLGGTLDIFITVGCVATILAIFNYILDDQS